VLPPDPDRAEAAPPPAPAPARLGAGPISLAMVGLFAVGLLSQGLSAPLGLLWTELFAFLAPAVALATLAGVDPRAALRLRRPPRGALLLGLLAGAAAFLAAGALMALWARLLPPGLVRALDVRRLFERPGWELAVLVGVAAGLAPLCEELAFRGHLLTALSQRRSPASALVLQAAFFAGLHVDPVRFPALLLLGLVYGWLTVVAGSIWPAVLAHAVNNAAATALALKAAPERPPADGPLAASFITLVAAGALLALVGRAYQRTMPPPEPPEALLVQAPARPRWIRWVVPAGAAGLLIILLMRLLASA